MNSSTDIQNLIEQLDAAERDAGALVAGLDEEQGRWSQKTGSWSVVECLDHLVKTNGVYLEAMKRPALRARERGRFRHGPAVPGFAGRWFLRTLEPPVPAPFRVKAPRSVEPQVTLSLDEAFAYFATSQNQIRNFVYACQDLDLAGVGFPNPFVRGIRFSLATGLHVIIAHERRHLWQAWRVRRAAECAVPNPR